jgi:hypothetical protein
MNKMRHDTATPLITDDYFRGGVDMLQFLKLQVEEYAQASELNKPNVAPQQTS